MAGKHIPEDIIVDILSRLPVKSLCRFRCVSKRWRSIVSDPQFAKVQFKVASEQKTLSRRLLLYRNAFEIESLDLETPWYGDNHSLRKLTGPFEYRERSRFVNVLGSCNGLVFVATRYPLTGFYIWNPSTGFSHNLPDPGFPNEMNYISYSGLGYLPATDDYKVLVAASDILSPGEEVAVEVKIFSTRAGLWKRIESPFKLYLTDFTSAVLLEETFHWVCDSVEPVIYAFDLVTEKFREMPTLDQNDNTIHLLNVDSYGGSLYGFRHGYDAWDSIELWVMREYGVSDSWTKLLNINFSNQLEPEYMQMLLFPFLATETRTVLAKLTLKDCMMEVIRIEHEDEPFVTDRLQMRDDYYRAMIIYEESLLRIPDYHALEEYKVKETENPTHGPPKLKSRGIIASCRALYFWLSILIFTVIYFKFSFV